MTVAVGPGAGDSGGRRSNGLDAPSFRRLSDIDPRLVPELLESLAVANIAAYVTPAMGSMGTFLNRSIPPRPLHSLYVDADRLTVARTIVEPVLSTSAMNDEAAAFDAIVAGFDDLPDLSEGDAVRDVVDPVEARPPITPAWGPRDYEPEPEDEHYVPPPPSPRQPVHTTTKWAWVSLVVGALLLSTPSLIGLQSGDGTVLMGTVAILLGIGLLVSRLRDSGPDDDINDDGAVV